MSDTAITITPSVLESLSHLPAELILIVLEHYLILPRPITRKTHYMFFQMRALPFLRDKTYAKVALEAYYSRNTFEITISEVHQGKNPAPLSAQPIRHLEFTMTFDNPARVPEFNRWTWPCTWLWHYPNLHSLKVIIKIDHDTAKKANEEDVWRAKKRSFTRGWLPPKDFVLAVVCQGSCWDRNLMVSVKCDCAKEFEKELSEYTMDGDSGST